MRLGIFSRPDDPLARHVSELALARGIEILQVGLQGIAAGVPVAFDGDAWLLAGEDLQELDAVFVRNIPAEIVRPPDGPDRSPAAWWEETLAQSERASFAESALADLELRGVPMINPPLATRPFDHKPLQLAAFQRAGLAIPRTLITNYPQAVELFAADVGETIVKPLGGGHTTKLLDPAHLEAITTRPAIFQERIHGTDVRVTVVADRVASAVEIPTEALDYRAGSAYASGAQKYVEHALSDRGRDLALQAARICKHILSGVDLKHRGGDDYVLLEANSSPVYLAIELATGDRITDAILDALRL